MQVASTSPASLGQPPHFLSSLVRPGRSRDPLKALRREPVANILLVEARGRVIDVGSGAGA
jgi:hypothetical protein